MVKGDPSFKEISFISLTARHDRCAQAPPGLPAKVSPFQGCGTRGRKDSAGVLEPQMRAPYILSLRENQGEVGRASPVSSTGNRPHAESRSHSAFVIFSLKCNATSQTTSSHKTLEMLVRTHHIICNSETWKETHTIMMLCVCLCTRICVLKPNREVPFLMEACTILQSQQRTSCTHRCTIAHRESHHQ